MVFLFTMEFKKCHKIIGELTKDLEPYAYGIREELDAMNDASNLIRHILTFENRRYETELWQVLKQCFLAVEYTNGRIKEPLRNIESMIDDSMSIKSTTKERLFILDTLSAHGIITYDEKYLTIKNKVKLGMIGLLHTLLKMQYSFSEHQKLSLLAFAAKRRFLSFDEITGKLNETTFVNDKPETTTIHTFSINSKYFDLIMYIFEHQADWITYKEVKENVYNNSINDAKIPQFFKGIKLQVGDRINRYAIVNRKNSRFHFQTIYAEKELTVDMYRSCIEE